MEGQNSDHVPKNTCFRYQYPEIFQTHSASTNTYRLSFFPQPIRDKTDLPDYLSTSAEVSDECVSKIHFSCEN